MGFGIVGKVIFYGYCFVFYWMFYGKGIEYRCVG